MKLIGMLDSPYVRRVAICLKLLKFDFQHCPVSVFSNFEEFHKINPVVKAPTLVFDDGQTLMDSTLILDYVMTLSDSDIRLIPLNSKERLRATRLNALALAACEKTVQIVYERKLRPPEKQYEPWINRVRSQLLAAYAELESELAAIPFSTKKEQFGLAEVTISVAWQFTQMMLPEIIDEVTYPALRALSDFAEQLPAFISTPPV